jgi:hypothetical protein
MKKRFGPVKIFSSIHTHLVVMLTALMLGLTACGGGGGGSATSQPETIVTVPPMTTPLTTPTATISQYEGAYVGYFRGRRVGSVFEVGTLTLAVSAQGVISGSIFVYGASATSVVSGSVNATNGEFLMSTQGPGGTTTWSGARDSRNVIVGTWGYSGVSDAGIFELQRAEATPTVSSFAGSYTGTFEAALNSPGPGTFALKIDANNLISGDIYFNNGFPAPVYGYVSGSAASFDGQGIDGSGISRIVQFVGTVSSQQNEIVGTWTYPSVALSGGSFRGRRSGN